MMREWLKSRLIKPETRTWPKKSNNGSANSILPKDARGNPIVHLNRLTSREVGDWMDAGNDIIFVPHGPISGHGPWTTLGIHCHCAEAVAVLLARKCGGIVYPPLFTAFCGATHLYPGSVPFSYEFHTKLLKTVCHSLYNQGWKRIFMICHTWPEELAATMAAIFLISKGNCRSHRSSPRASGIARGSRH